MAKTEESPSEDSERSVASAKCAKECTDHLCVCAWPDGSCGAYPQGKFFPPLYTPPKQSSTYVEQSAMEMSDSDMLDFMDSHNAESDGTRLYWTVHKGQDEKIRISQTLQRRSPQDNQRLDIRLAITFGMDMEGIESNPFLTDTMLLDWMDKSNTTQGWEILATDGGVRVTLAYGPNHANRSARLSIRDAIRGAVLEAKDSRARAAGPPPMVITALDTDDIA